MARSEATRPSTIPRHLRLSVFVDCHARSAEPDRSRNDKSGHGTGEACPGHTRLDSKAAVYFDVGSGDVFGTRRSEKEGCTH